MSTGRDTSSYAPVLPAAIALVGGILADAAMGYPVGVWLTSAVLFLLLWATLWRAGRDRLASLSLLVAVAAVGATWHHDRWRWFAVDDWARGVGERFEPIALEGELLAPVATRAAPAPSPLAPTPQTARARLELRVVAVRDGRSWRAASGECTAFVDGELKGPKVGERLRIYAQAARIAPPANPGEPDFANRSRGERRLGRLSVEFPQCVERIGVARPGFDVWLGAARERFAARLARHVSPERAPLAAAMLLGTRESLSFDEQDRFLRTGTIHLLAISGMNLAVLAWAVGGGVVRFVGARRVEIALVGGFVVGYALLVGGEPPVARAAVIAVAALAARGIGRVESPWNTLALAAIVVLAVNPRDVFSLGAQLSFIAVAVLIATKDWRWLRPPADPLDRLIWETRPWATRLARRLWAGFCHAACVATAIWFFTLPLAWSRNQLVSPVAAPLNLVAAAPANASLVCGFLSLVLDGCGLSWLADAAGWLCSRSLDALDAIVRVGEAVPQGYAWRPSPPAWLVALLFGGWLTAMLARAPLRWQVAGGVAWLAGALWLTTEPTPPRDPSVAPATITFISVGHGLSAFVELPDGRTLLYDGGRMGPPEPGARLIAGAILGRGRTRIDAIVLSHADLDHYNAVPELIERFSVGAVYVSNRMFDRKTPALVELKSAIERAGVPLKTIRAGDRLASDGVATIDVLHPSPLGVLGSDNAQSVVLQIEHQGRRALLTGDLEAAGLRAMLNETPRTVDVLLAPHHGSRNSDPRGLAQWATPRHVVVSGGAADDLETAREVAAAYEGRGAVVWHTLRHGAVTVTLGDSIGVAPFKTAPVQDATKAK